jgi:hypothetical protein
VQWTFQCLKNRGGLVQIDAFRQLKVDWRDLERLWLSASRGRGERNAQAPVYGLLEGLAGSSILLLQESCHVIVNRQSSSHIMMLSLKTS